MKFEIDEDGISQIKEWVETLPTGPYGSIGGRLSYTFTPTSLGVITVIKDAMSGEEINITDFESW